LLGGLPDRTGAGDLHDMAQQSQMAHGLVRLQSSDSEVRKLLRGL
jgi:hypothetical protein